MGAFGESQTRLAIKFELHNKQSENGLALEPV